MTFKDKTVVITGGAQGIGKCIAGRVGNPMDIANMVLFLASDRSSYVSGQVLSIDGAMG